MQAGTSFADTCASLSAQFENRNLAADTGAMLRRWVDEELLSAVVDPA